MRLWLITNPVEESVDCRGAQLLIPGAGQFYQGRYFKAVVYFVCTYRPVRHRHADGRLEGRLYSSPGNAGARGKSHTLQFWRRRASGCRRSWRMIQETSAYYSPENKQSYELSSPLRTTFRGEWRPAGAGEDVKVDGVIELETGRGRFGGR